MRITSEQAERLYKALNELTQNRCYLLPTGHYVLIHEIDNGNEPMEIRCCAKCFTREPREQEWAGWCNGHGTPHDWRTFREVK